MRKSSIALLGMSAAYMRKSSIALLGMSAVYMRKSSIALLGMSAAYMRKSSTALLGMLAAYMRKSSSNCRGAQGLLWRVVHPPLVVSWPEGGPSKGDDSAIPCRAVAEDVTAAEPGHYIRDHLAFVCTYPRHQADAS